MNIDGVIAALGESSFSTDEAAIVEQMLSDNDGSIPEKQLLDEIALSIAIHRRRRKRLRDDLWSGPSYKFCDWPNRDVPKVAAGVYTIWHGSRLIYVGMSGRGMTADDLDAPDEPKKAKGLYTRLDSHSKGRRSGDQFCVYVCDYLVVPQLTADQQHQIGMFELSLDEMTKQHIHDNFHYRYVITKDGAEAFAIEMDIRRRGYNKLPYLNPFPPNYKGKGSDKLG